MLIIILILILRFGGSGSRGGCNDEMFLVIGVTVGFCLMVTATIIGHLLGDILSMLELTSDVLAVILFGAVGINQCLDSKLGQ